MRGDSLSIRSAAGRLRLEQAPSPDDGVGWGGPRRRTGAARSSVRSAFAGPLDQAVVYLVQDTNELAVSASASASAGWEAAVERAGSVGRHSIWSVVVARRRVEQVGQDVSIYATLQGRRPYGVFCPTALFLRPTTFKRIIYAPTARMDDDLTAMVVQNSFNRRKSAPGRIFSAGVFQYAVALRQINTTSTRLHAC